MTRIAVLADIHGNVPALEAVLADLATQEPDEILVGGDLVGRGPQGTSVVERLAELGFPTISGNHEDYLLAFRHRQVPPEWLEAEEWAASRWMAAELSDHAVARIEGLPFSIASQAAPELRLVHGTPSSNQHGIGPWTSQEEVADHLESVAEPVLVCAHTHRPLLRRLDSRLVVNVGSVGLPFNRDRRAQYAILTHRNGGWDVDFRQVDYDLGRILDIYETSGFLTAGGVTARLLRMEVEHAVPLLVPFHHWAKAMGVAPRSEHMETFLRFHQPGQSLGAFFERLAALP